MMICICVSWYKVLHIAQFLIMLASDIVSPSTDVLETLSVLIMLAYLSLIASCVLYGVSLTVYCDEANDNIITGCHSVWSKSIDIWRFWQYTSECLWFPQDETQKQNAHSINL